MDLQWRSNCQQYTTGATVSEFTFHSSSSDISATPPRCYPLGQAEGSVIKLKTFTERRGAFTLKDKTIGFLKTTTAGRVVEGRVCFCKLSATMRFGLTMIGPDVGVALSRKRRLDQEKEEEEGPGQAKKAKK